MIATLEFELPEEREDFENAVNAGKFRCAIAEFDNFLRYRYKHQDPKNESARLEYEEIKNRFYECLNEFLY